MKQFIILIWVFCASCELVKIGSGNTGIINPTQEYSIGTIYLLKAELDSGNTIGASELLIHPNGTAMKAMERYKSFNQLQRIGHIMKGKQIVYAMTDTIAVDKHSITCSFDYLQVLTFSLLKSDKSWFISDIKE